MISIQSKVRGMKEKGKKKGWEKLESEGEKDAEGLEMSGFEYKTGGKVLYYLCVIFSFGIVALLNRWFTSHNHTFLSLLDILFRLLFFSFSCIGFK